MSVARKILCFFIVIIVFASVACKSKEPITNKRSKANNYALMQERDSLLREIERLKGKDENAYIDGLKNALKEAMAGFNAEDLSVEMRNGKIYVSMSDKLLFRSGSATVEQKGKEALKTLALVLQKNTQIEILVEGHTDNLPIRNSVYKDNWDLSTARATSIVRILSADYKVPPTNLVACGRGEFYPIANNSIADGRAKNRRTEIIISPKLEALFKILN